MTTRSARLSASRRVPVGLAAALLVLSVALLAGCGGGGNEVETDPPDGWQTDGGAHWWTEGADTARAFRDLSTVQAMGVVEGSPVFSASGEATDEQVAFATKRELQKLYRKDPETVDSLFNEYVMPRIESVPRSGDMQARVSEFGRESNDRLREHFYPPAQKLQLGTDVPIGYPDSLFQQGIGGTVWMQVRVGDTGKPQAIKLLEGTHPVLDATARRAAAQMEWEPARVRSGSHGWKDIPSWTWVSVSLGSSS